MSGWVGHARVVALAALLGGCAVTPEPAPPPAAAVPDRLHPAAEEAWRERAQAAARERRWADALQHWELLALLRPESGEYRAQQSLARERISESVRKSLAAGDHARQRGDLESAQVEYLRVLSLDHANAQAAEGLRAIERARVQRNYLGRKPRLVL